MPSDLQRKIERLKRLLANCYNWRDDPPCKICGYNGPDYFDGTEHECAAIYHLVALSRCAPKAEAREAALVAAVRSAVDWRALDGDGITDPVRSQLLASTPATPSRERELREALQEARNYIDSISDVIDGERGYRPNSAASLVVRLDAALASEVGEEPSTRVDELEKAIDDFYQGVIGAKELWAIRQERIPPKEAR